tara:strand:+ start:1573 stop:3333 length:1761 start_codon:yes stop_codon:yes gene_type:complete
MSGTGSLMIRNLKKPSDYSKAVMTQDELLRIAIANDANVAQARQGFQRGEVQEQTPQQLKSPAELQADIALQEKTGLDNLLRLFQYREASSIIASLNPDEIFTMNQSFPEIERDISRRFAKGLVSPTFFVEYLRKFKEELEQSKGVSTNLSGITNKFNALTDNINDIRAILPTRNQFATLQDYLEDNFDRLPRMVVAPLLDRIQRLQNAIPSNEEFRRVSADNEILQYETLNMLQNITADMPTQVQIQRILADINSGRVSQQEGVQQIEDALSGVSDAQLDALEEIKREIAESSTATTRGGDNIEILAQVVVGTRAVPRLAVARAVLASGTPSTTQNIYIVGEIGNQKLTLGELKALLGREEGFRNWYASNIGGVANVSNLKDYIVSNALRPPSSAMSDATDKETFSTEKSGFGLKAKNGRIRTKKIGAGVKYEPEPTYRQFGKYVINMPQLKERDILNVKFPSLGRIPQFKPTPISDVMKEFVLELLDTGKVSNRIYEQIPIEERQLFEKIATGAGILNALKLKRTLSNEDKEDNDRFTLLKGEYLAGNNSVALLKELRKLVVKFMSQGKISKQDGMNLLIELSV